MSVKNETAFPVIYQTTFDECLQRINEYDGVCEGCGAKLEPIETLDNSNNPTFWQGCKVCICFRSGVKRKYFEIARELVKNKILIPYPHIDFYEYNTPEKLEYYYQCQCAGLSHTIAQIDAMLTAREVKHD
jgi:hypothetical protein